MFKSFIKFGVLILGLLAQNTWADFSQCGKSTEEELNSFRTGKNFTQLAADYIKECASHSALVDEMTVSLERISIAEDNAIRARQVRETLSLLITKLNARTTPIGNVNSDALEAVRRGLECEQLAVTSQAALDQAQCEDNLHSEDGTVSLQAWQAEARRPIFKSAFTDPFGALAGGCGGKKFGEDTACDDAFVKGFLPILEYQSFMHVKVTPAANDKRVQEIAAGYSSSHEQWKSYLSDTGFQYPWELTYNRARRGGFKEIATLKPAPTSRYILLHPTVAIAHSDESPDGEQVRVMGVLKVYGYKWWSYKGDRASNVWGISGTLNVADMPDVDDEGYGVMLEYNQYALGWSDHGGDNVISLSIDLGELWADQPDTLQGWLDKIE